MTRYAQATTVSQERSREEIERTLRRYGCDQFFSGWDAEGLVAIGFSCGGRMVRMLIPMPPKRADEFVYRTYRGRPIRHRPHSASKTQELWEQACRVRWRAALLIVKAKIEAVESGVSTFEREFMPDILLPDGRTVGEFMSPQIENAYKNGKMPALLPAMGTVSND